MLELNGTDKDRRKGELLRIIATVGNIRFHCWVANTQQDSKPQYWLHAFAPSVRTPLAQATKAFGEWRDKWAHVDLVAVVWSPYDLALAQRYFPTMSLLREACVVRFRQRFPNVHRLNADLGIALHRCGVLPLQYTYYGQVTTKRPVNNIDQK